MFFTLLNAAQPDTSFCEHTFIMFKGQGCETEYVGVP